MANSDNLKAYERLNNEEKLFEPSLMGIVPNDSNFELSEAYLKETISRNSEFNLKSITEKRFDDSSYLGYEINLVYKGILYKGLIAKVELDKEQLTTFSFANEVRESETRAALAKDFYIDISIVFGEDALESYLFQLKLMNTIVPDACLGIDSSSYSVFSIDWIKMLVEADVPPAPKYLYRIHAVYDDKEGERIYWLHTHGLLRCGSMEIEAVNIKYGVEQVHNLLTAAADKFIEYSFKENEKFQIGYDGMGLFLTWVRWEDILKDYPHDMLGGTDERTGENNAHAGASGILFAVEDNNELVSPEIYVDALQQNPVFWISSQETARMRALALSQWKVFSDAFVEYGKKENVKKTFFGKMFGGNKQNEEAKWTFMVKLGLVVDKAESENDKEHLWFEVEKIDGKNLIGKLLNQPYWIASLKEGDVKTYPIQEVLTDWLVYSPNHSYSPDSAYTLKDQLQG